jgi:putative cardiolipin synthase
VKKHSPKIVITGWGLLLLYLLISIFAPHLYCQQVHAAALVEPIADCRERVLCIDDNEQALEWRLRMIDLAQEELVLVTFSLRNDNSGQDIMSALYNAAERGVTVKILIDGILGTFELAGSHYFSALISHPNVQAKLYNPINILKLRKANYRMHDKYMIVDHNIYLLGGRNTNDMFLGSYVDKYKIDRDILVYSQANGQSMAQLREYFDRIWKLSCNKEPLAAVISQIADTQADMAKRYRQIKDRYPEPDQEIDWESETIETKGIILLTNPIEPENKKPELLSEMYQIIQQGKSFIIETPYIICDDNMYEKLGLLNKDDKDLQIIINAVESGANPFGCADYLNHKENIQRTGSDIFEALCDQSLHRKTILVDDSLSIVGSYNWDIRSTYLDTGSMLAINSPELNSQLRNSSLDLMKKSRHIAPDGTETLGDEFVPIKLSFGKHLFYNILRIVILPIRNSL